MKTVHFSTESTKALVTEDLLHAKSGKDEFSL